MSGCAWSDDGRHRFRFLGPSAWSAEPRYGCGPTCPTVLVTGDGLAEDVDYLAELGGVLVAACAGCDAEVRVGECEDAYVADLPVGPTVVCLTCGPDEADALAELAAIRAEHYGEVIA